VTPAKQRQVVRVAEHFLARHPALYRHAMRFEVVAVERRDDEVALAWVRDAFAAS
jgi:Holliday junction resolvase-like predicted endonuclease